MIDVAAARSGAAWCSGSRSSVLLEYRDSSFKTEDDVMQLLQAAGAGADPDDGVGARARGTSGGTLLMSVGAAVVPRSAPAALSSLWKLQVAEARRMYQRFYGLRELPFELTPNPRFLFLTPQHREALSNLQYGLSTREGGHRC